MYNNIKEIQKKVQQLEQSGERIVDILIEIQRIYQLDVDSLKRLLTKEQKEKMLEQELKLKNIRN